MNDKRDWFWTKLSHSEDVRMLPKTPLPGPHQSTALDLQGVTYIAPNPPAASNSNNVFQHIRKVFGLFSCITTGAQINFPDQPLLSLYLRLLQDNFETKMLELQEYLSGKLLSIY